jgi:hypothetical protein
MKVFLISTLVFGLALLGMALGVLLSNRRIKGSCGGLAGLRDEQGNPMCEACSSPSPTCQGAPHAASHDEACGGEPDREKKRPV